MVPNEVGRNCTCRKVITDGDSRPVPDLEPVQPVIAQPLRAVRPCRQRDRFGEHPFNRRRDKLSGVAGSYARVCTLAGCRTGALG